MTPTRSVGSGVQPPAANVHPTMATRMWDPHPVTGATPGRWT